MFWKEEGRQEVRNFFAYSCVPEIFKHYLFFQTKTYVFSADEGFAPTPTLAFMSDENAFF